MLHKVCLPVTGIPEVTKEGTDALDSLCMKALIEQKEIVINWLMKYYDKYGKSNRDATRNNYRRAVMTYFVFTICKTVS